MTDVISAPRRPLQNDHAETLEGPTIDRAHLARYTMGDRTLENEVLVLFRDHSRAQIAQLKEAVGDPGAWHAVTHGIKGSARGIGAWALGQAAAEAEQDKNAPTDVQIDHCTCLTSHIDEANRCIEAILAS